MQDVSNEQEYPLNYEGVVFIPVIPILQNQFVFVYTRVHNMYTNAYMHRNERFTDIIGGNFGTKSIWNAFRDTFFGVIAVEVKFGW